MACDDCLPASAEVYGTAPKSITIFDGPSGENFLQQNGALVAALLTQPPQCIEKKEKKGRRRKKKEKDGRKNNNTSLIREAET